MIEMNEADLMAAKAQLIMKLRAKAIMDPAILAAIERVPREAFLPRALRPHAYENASLPIAYGQTISQPFVIATALIALAIEAPHRVLEIGTGTG